MRNRVGFFIFSTLLVIGFINCETDSSCNCPNGTVHLIGESCCSYSDCNCETGVVGQRIHGIAVRDDTDGGTDEYGRSFVVTVGRINLAIEELVNEGEGAVVANMKIKIKEIVVIAETAMYSDTPLIRSGPDANGKYIVTITTARSASDIATYFYLNF